MKRKMLTSLATLIAASMIVAPGAPADPGSALDPGGAVTDDPAGEHHHGLGFDGSGFSTVEPFLGGQPAGKPGSRRSRDLRLEGALKLDPFNAGVHGDVAAFKKLAFVGKWREACPGTGVDIVDISRPSSPVKIADTADYADTSMEDMQAMRIGSRDVLAIGLQDCGNNLTPGVGKSALELVDITNPRAPRTLSLFDVDALGVDATGVHELDLTTTANGRVLALLAVPDLEARTSDDAGLNGSGDLLIVDITNPVAPVAVGEWGVLDHPALGVPFYLDVRQGADARTYLHSVRANADGTRAYLSYWDAGVLTLDISDPASPVLLGRTAFAPGEEGNAHSVDEGRGGSILAQADEDYTPFHSEFRSSAFAGTRPAIEAAFTPLIAERPSRELAGEVVHVGRGCPANSIAAGSPQDPYLADPAGRIALVERGGCRFDHKVARAQLAGATGVIVFNNADGGEALVLMGGTIPVSMPDGSSVSITIAAIFVQRSTGLLLRDATPPVTASVKEVFDGWGYLRLYDISDPANPVALSTFATANTNNEAVATEGTWSVHNPEIVGSRLYASWYSDGVRVIDISNPRAPRETAFWTGAGAPSDAPAVNIWSVVPHKGLLLASDRNFGLYVLKKSP
ncbi:MAG TPA: PA domain-containing protein [Solirubrobacteraceae bacterium]|nr:PA domain-containing protein [Solirubrobacteraceae bacterium]